MTFTRRSILAGAALGLASPLLARAQSGGSRFIDYPFKLGVASGSPSPSGVVLWTRLAPDPLHGGGMIDDEVEVAWEVAADAQFQKIARKGSFTALPELAHSVHAEVEGLEPGREYWYRFFAGREVSPIGRTMTLPAPNAAPSRLKLAYGSCQHYEQGYFAAHRHLAAEGLDLMIFLGDYIYESTWGDELVRLHSGGGIVTRTLAEYRDRHAQYKTDPDLQRLHGLVPWLLTWDDHEVANDYAGLDSERLEPDFKSRRQAAYQAFWEHQPLRMSQRPIGGSTRIYDRFRFGNLADLYLLDGRQYKSRQLCPRPGMGGSNVVDACAELADSDRSFFGAEQERWLAGELSRASAGFNIVAQQTLVAPADWTKGQGKGLWTDGWDGYPAARRRLLRALAPANVKNPLIIGGDIHQFVAADLHLDPANPKSPVVAAEVCGTSISSQGSSQEKVDELKRENPQLRFASAERRGYATLEITPKRITASMRGLDSEKKRDSGVSTVGKFILENGRRGLIGDAT